MADCVPHMTRQGQFVHFSQNRVIRLFDGRGPKGDSALDVRSAIRPGSAFDSIWHSVIEES